MPVRVRFDDLPADCLPRSASVSFSDLWQTAIGSVDYLDGLVDRWRSATATLSDVGRDLGAYAEALDVPQFEPQQPNAIEERLARARDPGTERREYGALRRKPLTAPAGAPPNVAVQHGGSLSDDMERLLGRR
jgi:hypothetical protein